jgi:hypothetical protein
MTVSKRPHKKYDALMHYLKDFGRQLHLDPIKHGCDDDKNLRARMGLR